MAATHFEQFLDKATVPGFGTDHPLTSDGLHVSRLLQDPEPTPDVTFRAGSYRCGVDVQATRAASDGRSRGRRVDSGQLSFHGIVMSQNPKHHAPRPKPQRPPLCCILCDTDSHLFISSIAPSPGSADPVTVSYTCTRCWVLYRQQADAAEFAGVFNTSAGSQDVLVFSGQYIHCRQSMQETASGVFRLGDRSADEESGNPLGAYLEIRVMECPCGFRLVLPD